MGIKKIVVLVLGCVFFLGCGSAKKTVVTNATLDNIMKQEAFMISVKTAEPLVTNALAQIANSGILPPGNIISRIDINGQGYFIKVDGQNVSTNLPYYGERQMGGGYGDDTGITFDGTARDLQITKDDEKQTYQVSFSVDNTSETYVFFIDINTGMNSSARVRSSHRNSIRYSGTVTKLENEEVVITH